MMRRPGMIVFGLCAGCAAAPGVQPAPAPTLTRSGEVLLAGPAPVVEPEIVPAGDGVAVRWAGARSLSLPAETEGLGPVVATRRGDAGELILVHAGGVEERWSVAGAGAEQAWRYPSRPAGDRVAVAVALAGARLDREADDGLWLRAETGELLRYGHATWVDAAGRRTAVRARWVGGRVAVEVPAAVVAASAFPAVLDPTITPAFTIENPAAVSVSVDHAELVATTTGALVFTTLSSTTGTAYDRRLVVVQALDAAGAVVPGSFRGVYATNTPVDFRVAPSGGGAWVVWQEGTRVVGVRVDAAGRSLDRVAVPLQAGTTLVDVACNAAQCMVLGRRPETQTAANGELMFSRFTPAGAALDAAPVVLGTPELFNGLSAHPLAALDDRFVATWSQVPAGSTAEVMVARIGLDGVVQDPGGRPVTTAGAVRIQPTLTSNRSALFLTFQASASGPRPAGLYTLALDRNLAALSSASVLLPREMSALEA